MTEIEQSINLLKRLRNLDSKKNEKLYDVAIESLEKQIPKKPISQYEYDLDVARFGICPNCNSEVNSQSKYCNDCGQHLDWSVEK